MGRCHNSTCWHCGMNEGGPSDPGSPMVLLINHDRCRSDTFGYPAVVINPCVWADAYIIVNKTTSDFMRRRWLWALSSSFSTDDDIAIQNQQQMLLTQSAWFPDNSSSYSGPHTIMLPKITVRPTTRWKISRLPYFENLQGVVWSDQSSDKSSRFVDVCKRSGFLYLHIRTWLEITYFSTLGLDVHTIKDTGTRISKQIV